ncbi:substrate-binding domain-containing protein [Nonomuraea purpurea]|uniref:Substrate-binding domain-containing protein n=1 Tax=Nonomuraea purpurea TaxID=1849276 RepID=A0ABV8FXJ7_9ACTN
MDAQAQVRQLQDAVTAQRFDVFVVQANDGAAVVPAVRSAVQAGISVVVHFTPAAWLSGIGVRPVRVGVFAISGVCAALAGLVLAARGGSAQADMGTLLELTAIAAAVIGGTSILGGQGAVWRGMVGVLILTLIGNGFNLLGWNSTYRPIVEGLLILTAVSVDHALRHRRDELERS